MASSTLDASAKIYAGRVDAIHAETYKVLSGLGRSSDKHKDNEDAEDGMSCVARKPVFGVSDQVRHIPGCTTTKDGQRLEFLDLESRGIVLSV